MAPVRKFVVGLGVTMLIALPQLSEASSDVSRSHAVSRGAVTTRTAGTFDWLAKPATTKAVFAPKPARIQRQIGRGSWICSPAGFGRGSRCHSN